jgi:hypothetical protein
MLFLQKPADVDRLAEKENVGAIICLQQDPDLAYFNLDLGAIRKRCAERKDIEHIRSPIRFGAPILFFSFWQRSRFAESRHIGFKRVTAGFSIKSR